MSYSQIAVALGVTFDEAVSSVRQHWASVESRAIEPPEMVLDRELSKLDALEARWLPLALHESLEITEDSENRSPGKVAASALNAGLKALNNVLKISALRAKILAVEGQKEKESEYEHLTLDKFDEFMREIELAREAAA